eukprot:3623882-Ditylum_brightwellii.AAC.1
MGEDFASFSSKEDDSDYVERVQEASLRWAVNQADSLFRALIEDLLKQQDRHLKFSRMVMVMMSLL